MIPVTRTFIPPIEEYSTIVKQAFDNGWLTNRGELVKTLEDKLKSELGVDNLLMMTNGTIPLQIALKLLGNKGEVITTPFSYVATTSSIIWEGCTPIFVDIDPEHLTIDETKIEAAITDRTTCILATHVFGNLCNVEIIDGIAKKYGLHVIYDAAHCFGVKYFGVSVFNFGTVSTCSMHATKIFHTGEGGAFFSKNELLMKQAFGAHNFGHDGFENFDGVGINAKISELQAAMGLSVLPYFEYIKSSRAKITEEYFSRLKDNFQLLRLRDGIEWNYSYFPVIFSSEEELIEVLNLLKEKNIFPRRYFFPSLNKLPYLIEEQNAPISESIAKRIICLPLYTGLELKDVDLICEILNSHVNNRS